MHEFTANAAVIGREESGETDAKIYLFTKEFGKISAKATSARKIGSKLAGHLQPLNLVAVRVVERRGATIADALTLIKGAPSRSALAVASLVRYAAPEGERDREIWDLLVSIAKGLPGRGMRHALKVFGYDPVLARCLLCGSPPQAFSVEDAGFYCVRCAVRSERVLPLD